MASITCPDCGQPTSDQSRACPSCGAALDAPVRFKCPNLEAALRAVLKKPEDAITREDLASLGDFKSDEGLTDLTGLEHANNLTKLNVRNNRITDVRPLANLTGLVLLDLFHNQITDLAPLVKLTRLTELHLGKNRITDVAPLAGLTSLTKLGLIANHITDVSPLAGLASLTSLYLPEIADDQKRMLEESLPNCEIHIIPA